jgi:thioredoxin-like negative regulator of GroEL
MGAREDMSIRQLSSDQYVAFVAEKSVAAVHFDADWDTAYRPPTRQRMREAAEALGERANFAEVGVDAEPDLARSIPLLNIPTVAYYRDGKLVAALIGSGQNVQERVERLLRGESIGYKDGTDRA